MSKHYEIRADFDRETIVVYQAYRPQIGHFAVKHGYFGGEFKLTRMSWIKPNFLWMMYRCGWAQKPGQEVVMWMKNTMIPLDMFFIEPDGRILRIAERTVPQSLTPIPSRGRVQGVLELNAGSAARLGIGPGDRVLHPAFGSSR